MMAFWVKYTLVCSGDDNLGRSLAPVLWSEECEGWESWGFGVYRSGLGLGFGFGAQGLV